MFIFDQDPFPGRCLNFTYDESDFYHAHPKRCLGHADDLHICQFPEDLVPFSFAFYSADEPAPWTVPPGFRSLDEYESS